MLKMRIFFKKAVKIASASGVPPKNPRLPPVAGEFPVPRVVTPVYYYNLVEFVSNVKYVPVPSKKNKTTPVNVLLCFFRTLAPIYHFKLCSFC